MDVYRWVLFLNLLSLAIRMSASWGGLIPSISTFNSCALYTRKVPNIYGVIRGMNKKDLFLFWNTTGLCKVNARMQMFSFKFSSKLLQMCLVPNTAVSTCWLSRSRSEWIRVLLLHPRPKSVCANMSSLSTGGFFHHISVVPQYSLQRHFQAASVIFNITTCQSTKDYYPFTLILLKRGYWLNLTTFK